MISVVTPSLGQLEWLRLCVASTSDQGGVEVEHIIQDAGTPGLDEKILSESVAKSDYRLRLFVEKDEGMYDAINRGLARAQGEICAYLNSDEQYLPDALQEVASFFARHPDVDVLFGDAILVSATGLPISYRRAIVPTLTHLRLADLNTLTCATFFSRRLIEGGHLFPKHLKVAGDQFWIFRLLKSGTQMAVLNKPLSVFTFTGDNLSQSAAAEVEKFGWLPADEKPHRWLTPLVVMWHRIKKLLAGAYRHRDVTVQIYTLDSPLDRRTIRARRVGFQWPQNTERLRL